MMQQKQPNDFATKKDAFNLFMMFLVAHQRALTVPFRVRYGAEALGFPGVWAAILIVLWASFSRDPLMWGWLVMWFLALAVRRFETMRLQRRGERLHSMYDGYPKAAMRFPGVRSETTAKLVIEPAMFFLTGFVFSFIEADWGLPARGFSMFLMTGIFTLPTLQIIRGTLMNKRVAALMDARIEQGAVMEGFRKRWGE
jgi:hypothetical protein